MPLDRQRATRRQETVRILLDQQMYTEHAELERQLADAMAADTDGSLASAPWRALADEVVACEQRIRDAEDEFTFECIDRQRWRDLLAQHPPTDEQRQAADHNWVTFRPAAIAASCTYVHQADGVELDGITVDDARWLQDTLPDLEWEKLWAACERANRGDGNRPKSIVASAARRLNGTSSATAAPEESLDRSS